MGDKFALQTTGNGKVYVAQPLDWEERSFYSLNISITDGANTIYTQVYTFNDPDIYEGSFMMIMRLCFFSFYSWTLPCWT